MNIEEILDNLKDSFENPTYMQRVYGSEDYDEIDNDYLLEPDKCKILYDYIKQLQQEKQEWINLLNMFKNQQKEFIEYLGDKIYSIEPKGTGINYNCEYDSEEDYINAMKEQSRLNTLKEDLSKYKEIIGGKDER